jgi:hypothetical protein
VDVVDEECGIVAAARAAGGAPTGAGPCHAIGAQVQGVGLRDQYTG